VTANYPGQAWCPKMMREHLCAQQGHAPDTETWVAFQTLIDVLDRHRPTGPDGKHGTLHTDTCGCDDRVDVLSYDGRQTTLHLRDGSTRPVTEADFPTCRACRRTVRPKDSTTFIGGFIYHRRCA
jgi:hypothetical protein